MRETFKELGFNFVDAIVLIFVAENPGIMQDEIANGLSIDKAAAARALKYLEQEGLLERAVDPNNQRMKRAYISARGNLYKAYFDKALVVWNRFTLQDLAEKEQSFIIDSLEKMKNRAISVDLKELMQEVKKIEQPPVIQGG